jgi:hypothetical protein
MSIDAMPRHQCLIYSGAPSRQLLALAEVIREKLAANFRCIYMNSPTMVSSLGSFLTALGVDVAHETEQANLLFISDRSHLTEGKFDPKRMLALLKFNLDQALNEGYMGLWASGDMAWEFGPESDFTKLLVYERGLDALIKAHPNIAGVCQYHAESLPHEAMRQGLALHPALFIDQNRSRENLQYVPTGRSEFEWPASAMLDSVLNHLCHETDKAS